MSFRVQLISVSGKDPETIHREYGVRPTGERTEFPDWPVVGGLLPSGDYLLYINDAKKIIPDETVYSSLSRGTSLIACYANETVMNSYACGWSNGVASWSVFHDLQQGADHLELRGPLPPQFPAIRDRLFAQQAEAEGADYIFDVAVELFAALGGIRYDEDIECESPEPWEVLEFQV